MPPLIIVYGEAAHRLLQDFGINDSLPKESLLVSFNLPRPLASWWWKNSAEHEEGRPIDTSGNVIEWGQFYRQLMPVVWKEQGYYKNEKGLNFRRVNDLGRHDPEKFYYVWAVKKSRPTPTKPYARA